MRRRGAGGRGGALRLCKGTGGRSGGGDVDTDFLSSLSPPPALPSSFLSAAGVREKVLAEGGREERRPDPDPKLRLGGRGGGRLYLGDISWLVVGLL